MTAVGELYRMHAGATLRWIAAKIHDSCCAEDVNTETWITVIRSIGTYQRRAGSAGWLGWLFTVTRSRMIDFLRNAAKRAQYEVYRSWADDSTHPHSKAPCPVESAERSACTAHVHTTMNVLSPTAKEVLALRFWCYMTVAETAAALDKSVPWVKMTQSRAVEALRKVTPEHVRELVPA